jgi:hypothetical protein
MFVNAVLPLLNKIDTMETQHSITIEIIRVSKQFLSKMHRYLNPKEVWGMTTDKEQQKLYWQAVKHTHNAVCDMFEFFNIPLREDMFVEFAALSYFSKLPQFDYRLDCDTLSDEQMDTFIQICKHYYDNKCHCQLGKTYRSVRQYVWFIQSLKFIVAAIENHHRLSERPEVYRGIGKIKRAFFSL